MCTTDFTVNIFYYFHQSLGAPKKVPPAVVTNVVTKPVTTFAKLFGKDGSLESHERNEYNKKSVKASENFIKTYLHPENAVMNLVVIHCIEKVAENRQTLQLIVKTIIVF